MRYRVVGVLGRGATAVVELAIGADGTAVARKRLSLTGSASEMDAARRRLRREAEIAGALRHPGIVPILTVEDDGTEVVIVMPALPANLSDHVAASPTGLDPVRATEAAQRLVGALASAHAAGVVHRDIKPANVLVDHAGRLALTDFGAATSHEVTAGLTVAGTVVGTPRWIAPEQARGDEASPAADVFALGATLLWAATGWTPWGDGPPGVLMARAAAGAVAPPPAGLDPLLRNILLPMVDPDPVRRPSAPSVLAVVTHLLGANVPPGATTVPRATTVRGATVADPPGAPPRRWPTPRAVRSRAGVRRLRALAVGRDGAPLRHPRAVATAGAVVVLGVATSVGVALGTGGASASAGHPTSPGRPVAAAPTPAACVARPYEPCGQPPAPHTDGTSCLPGWFDLDGSAADGCEAHSDWVAGTVVGPGTAVRANVVPADAVDSFTAPASSDVWSLCGGHLDLVLTAPTGVADTLTVTEAGRVVGTATSVDGVSATVSVGKPGCFGSYHDDLQLAVRNVAGATGSDFTLTRHGGW